MSSPLPGLIGLTGNIATGKSEVRNALAALGCAVIDADQVARDIVAPGQPALARIRETFGDGYLLADGTLDRRKLGNLVFNDVTELRKLEAITHPAARAELWRRIARAYAGQHRVVLIEVIRLFEGGYAPDCAEVWVTTCPPELQVQRLMQARGLSADEARARVNAQPPQAEKTARATRVFDTSVPLDDTRREVAAALRAMMRGDGKRA
jgi:dephospho-CoA kinase